MRRAGTIVLAVVCLLALLCAPGRAYAQDELKNDDPDKYYILLDIRNQIVTVYERDADGEYTKIVRCFLCASGRSDVDDADPEDEATPTPRGIWKIGGRERFGKFANFDDEYARYWVQIVGSIYFHSLLFADRTVDSLKRTPFFNMGQKVSHGCVRLYVEDAKWLYYYACPGTTVEITASQPANRALRDALKTKMTFEEYDAFQKTITDDAPEQPNQKAWVSVRGARIRKGSGASFDSVCRLAEGDELEVLLDNDIWTKVRYGRYEGYILRGYITYKQGEMDTIETATLLKTTEWIYEEPDDDSLQICKVPSRASVKVIETRGDGWSEIEYENETGFLRSGRLTTGWGLIRN